MTHLDHEVILKSLEGLNPGQAEAVQKSARQRVTVIQGPPGTGKTHVAVSIILTAVAAGEKVLVVAETNIAVDNITRRLVRQGFMI